MVSETEIQIDLVEIVYDPDQGIYARLRELESWKRVHTKLMWITVSSLVGICTAVSVNYVLGVG